MGKASWWDCIYEIPLMKDFSHNDVSNMKVANWNARSLLSASVPVDFTTKQTGFFRLHLRYSGS